MQKYEDLKVWRKAHELTLKVYSFTEIFPRKEDFGLTSQMRRAASSIPMNIVEGCGRFSNKEFANFLQIALGSANEIEYQLLLAKDLTYINEEIYQENKSSIGEIIGMLINLIRKSEKTIKRTLFELTTYTHKTYN